MTTEVEKLKQDFEDLLWSPFEFWNNQIMNHDNVLGVEQNKLEGLQKDIWEIGYAAGHRHMIEWFLEKAEEEGLSPHHIDKNGGDDE